MHAGWGMQKSGGRLGGPAGSRPAGYVGAYLGGSTVALAPDAPMPGGSDLDVYVALEGPLPEKRGKFEYQGALLEVSYVSWAAIFPAERR